MRPHTAMIFAAGFGTRMRPLTSTTPKPLIPVCGKPLLEYQIEQFATFGIKRLVINTHYLAEQLHDYVEKNQHRWPNIEFIISHEDTILETGGGLVRARKWLGDEPVFITNSDVILIDGNIPALEQLVSHYTPPLTMLLHPTDQAIGYYGKGDFACDNGLIRVSDSSQKPYTFTGLRLADPNLVTGYDEIPFSLVQIFNKLLAQDQLHGIIHTGEWLHVDSEASLHEAEEFLNY